MNINILNQKIIHLTFNKIKIVVAFVHLVIKRILLLKNGIHISFRNVNKLAIFVIGLEL